jgi:hypothetical protein
MAIEVEIVLVAIKNVITSIDRRSALAALPHCSVEVWTDIRSIRVVNLVSVRRKCITHIVSAITTK